MIVDDSFDNESKKSGSQSDEKNKKSTAQTFAKKCGAVSVCFGNYSNTRPVEVKTAFPNVESDQTDSVQGL